MLGINKNGESYMIIDFDNLDINATRLDKFGKNPGLHTPMTARLFALLGVETLDLRNLHGESVQCICNLFHWCRKLRHVIFNNISLPNVETACDLFDGCCSLEQVDVIGIKPLFPSNRILHGLFRHTKLKQVDINDFANTREELPAESYDRMFGDMQDIQYINIYTLYLRPRLMVDKSSFKYKNKSMFIETPDTVKINLPNDKITRQIVLKNLICSGWTPDKISHNCTLRNEPFGYNDVLMESAENIDFDTIK